jgi:hypothetical protein
MAFSYQYIVQFLRAFLNENFFFQIFLKVAIHYFFFFSKLFFLTAPVIAPIGAPKVAPLPRAAPAAIARLPLFARIPPDIPCAFKLSRIACLPPRVARAFPSAAAYKPAPTPTPIFTPVIV